MNRTKTYRLFSEGTLAKFLRGSISDSRFAKELLRVPLRDTFAEVSLRRYLLGVPLRGYLCGDTFAGLPRGGTFARVPLRGTFRGDFV